MKKLKIWSIMMLIAMALPMMVACGGDDSSDGGGNEDSQLISKAIGTWMCTQSTDSGQGQTYQGLMVGKEVTIYANGTYSSTASSFGYTGTYTVNGNKITARSNNGNTFVITVSISGDRMTWDGTASNGVTFRYIFVREDDASHQTIIPISNEMISSTSWKVKNINIERGKSSSIQNGKVIKFNGDGSCEGFHTMETAWRINSGRIETYYKKTNEPIYVYTLLSQNGDEVQVRVNGTLDDDLSAVLTMEKQNDVPIKDYFSTRDGVIGVRNGCYSSCANFLESQRSLENLRISGAAGSITPLTNNVKKAWESAYETISLANNFLYASETLEDFGINMRENEKKEAIAEVRALRAFVYYNIAVLWGNAPLITKTIDVTEMVQHSSQNTIFDFASVEISAAIESLPSYNINELGHFTRDAGLAFMAELHLSLGNSYKAKSIIARIDSEKYKGELPTNITNYQDAKCTIWTFCTVHDDFQGNRVLNYYPIYTYNHLVLFEKEASGNTSSLVDDWKNTKYMDYGYWATLKRMGKAQTVTGCQDYELLMPFPNAYIMSSPNVKQNPGY